MIKERAIPLFYRNRAWSPKTEASPSHTYQPQTPASLHCCKGSVRSPFLSASHFFSLLSTYMKREREDMDRDVVLLRQRSDGVLDINGERLVQLLLLLHQLHCLSIRTERSGPSDCWTDPPSASSSEASLIWRCRWPGSYRWLPRSPRRRTADRARLWACLSSRPLQRPTRIPPLQSLESCYSSSICHPERFFYHQELN